MFSCHQELKVFLLCLAVFIAATSAATVCKCEEKKVQIKLLWYSFNRSFTIILWVPYSNYCKRIQLTVKTSLRWLVEFKRKSGNLEVNVIWKDVNKLPAGNKPFTAQ